MKRLLLVFDATWFLAAVRENERLADDQGVGLWVRKGVEREVDDLLHRGVVPPSQRLDGLPLSDHVNDPGDRKDVEGLAWGEAVRGQFIGPSNRVCRDIEVFSDTRACYAL